MRILEEMRNRNVLVITTRSVTSQGELFGGDLTVNRGDVLWRRYLGRGGPNELKEVYERGWRRSMG